MDTCRRPSSLTTVTRNLFPAGGISVFISVILTFISVSCSSTETEDMTSSDPASLNSLVINLSTPDTYTFPTTREGETDPHAGHQLRYIAKLYKSDGNNNHTIASDDSNCIRCIEKLAKDGDQIIFTDVDPTSGFSYFVSIFADYIDADVQKDETGHYPDKYYVTKKESGTSVTGYDASRIYYKVTGEKFFNNHNLDCFRVFTGDFIKSYNSGVTIDLDLTRCVSQVRVVSNTAGGNIGNVNNITINNFRPIDNLDLKGGYGNTHMTSRPSVTISPAADNTEDILFFCYSFPLSNGTSGNYSDILESMAFSLNAKDGVTLSKVKWETPSNGINLVANTIYKVQGNFLQTSTNNGNQGDEQGDENQGTTVTTKDITVNITQAGGWNENPVAL